MGQRSTLAERAQIKTRMRLEAEELKAFLNNFQPGICSSVLPQFYKRILRASMEGMNRFQFEKKFGSRVNPFHGYWVAYIWPKNRDLKKPRKPRTKKATEKILTLLDGEHIITRKSKARKEMDMKARADMKAAAYELRNLLNVSDKNNCVMVGVNQPKNTIHVYMRPRKMDWGVKNILKEFRGFKLEYHFNVKDITVIQE